MRKIIIPNTNMESSKLGFGTASLHHLIRNRDRKELLSAALDLGFSHFDTAPMYGEGMAERDLGKLLVSSRSKVTISTKIGYPSIAPFEHFPIILYAHRGMGKVGRNILPKTWNHRKRSLNLKDIEKSFTNSLRNLRTDWIDLLLIHEPQITEIDALLNIADWLEAQKIHGHARYLGLAGNASKCVEVVSEIPGLFDVLQVEDSLDKHEADAVIKAGLPLQITFGYLRASAVDKNGTGVKSVIKSALDRINEGMVLLSSRNIKRLKYIASIVESQEAR